MAFEGGGKPCLGFTVRLEVCLCCWTVSLSQWSVGEALEDFNPWKAGTLVLEVE